MPYAELEVTVQARPERGYTVDMRLRAAPGDLDRELAARVPIQIDTAQLLSNASDAETYGAQLAQALFADQRLREAWIAARTLAEARELPLRIRLRLDPNDRELHGLRWETLVDDQGSTIARSERYLLSRYLDSNDLTRFTTPPRSKVSAIIAIASPTNLGQFNLDPFDVQLEALQARRSLSDLPTAMLTSDHQPVTLVALLDALRKGAALLYLVCHGRMINGVPYLALQHENGAVDWVAGGELASGIADLGADQRPVLVVLASCQSVGVDHGNTVPAALGPQLARAGVAAVLGMQGNVPLGMVARLMPRFFAQLVKDGQIDRALAVARAGLRSDDPWWMPVLFLRPRDGLLWRDDTPRATGAPKRLPLWLAGGLALLVLLAVTALVLTGQRRQQAEGSPPATAPGSGAPAPLTPPAPTLALLSPTAVPTVAPVADGKYMVLVADLEQQGAQTRDYARDIYDDLQRNIEAVLFAEIEIRRYRAVVTSREQADEVTSATSAAVIVWGRYDESRITLQVQSGDSKVFNAIPANLERAFISRTTDISLQLSTTDSPFPSAASAVLTAFNVLESADGDGFGIMRIVTLQDRLKATVAPAEIAGQGAAAHLNRFMGNFFDNPEEALQEMNLALRDEPDNPFLYMYRAVVQQRLKAFASAREDLEAAERLVPGWSTPTYQKAVNSYALGDLDDALKQLDLVLTQRPVDWLTIGYRGGVHYLLGNMQQAREDLEQSIALGPSTSLPYGYAVILALREGRVEDAQELVAEARSRFAAQRGFDNSFYSALFGQENVIGLASSTFDLFLADQYVDALATTDRALALSQGLTLPPQVPADLYFMRGFAQCNAGDAAAAAQSYSEALVRSPEFALLHLLRADVRKELGDGLGAIEDMSAAAASSQADQLRPTIQRAQFGTLTCQNVLEPL